MPFTAGQKVRTSDLLNGPFAQGVGGWAATGASNLLTAGAATSETDLGSRAQSGSITFQQGHLYVATLSLTGNASAGLSVSAGNLVLGGVWVFSLRVVAAVGGGGSLLFGGTGSVSKLEFFAIWGGDDWAGTQNFAYVPTSTFTSSVYTSYVRAQGSGTMTLYGNSGCMCVINDYGSNSGILLT